MNEEITTVEAFDAMIRDSSQGGQVLEFIGGEVVEAPGNAYLSALATHIQVALGTFLKGKNWGHLTGESRLYQVAGERYAPDVACISKSSQPELNGEGAIPVPPELAVEIIADEMNAQEQRHLRIKTSNYLAAGSLVWVVCPVSQVVEVHQPRKPVQIIDKSGTVDGGNVLPGFTLDVRTIFSE